jgi:hypothetical protein
MTHKVPDTVTPAKAGVYQCLITLDSGFRRNDGKRLSGISDKVDKGDAVVKV